MVYRAEDRQQRPAATPSFCHRKGRGAGGQARRPADRSDQPRAAGHRSMGRGSGPAVRGRDDRSRRSRQGAGNDSRNRQRKGKGMNVPQAATLARTPSQSADDAPHLLLVDDDRRIRDLLSRFLCGEGYRVTTAMSASDARAKLLGLHFDLLILDVMMPGETGFDLARFIRKSSSVPIVMLTARHEAESRIEGLQIGADDYVAKPFEPRELVLRIGNILKRTAPPPVETLEQVAFGPYVYHLDRGELRQGDETIHLTDRA